MKNTAETIPVESVGGNLPSQHYLMVKVAANHVVMYSKNCARLRISTSGTSELKDSRQKRSRQLSLGA